jgi:hypothetical protein
MRSYGCNELLLDMDKAKKAAPTEYAKMMQEIDISEEAEGVSISSIDIGDKLEELMDKFIDKILFELEVGIYPINIPSEAEGADGYAGKLVWCILPEFFPEVLNAMERHISWVEFG